jgi:signal recognition particle GTPase
MLYKGFSVLTNLGYFDVVPMTAIEMLLGIITQNIKVIIDAYILGTLFHYLVKKDPEMEATKQLVMDLEQYCLQRHLPQELVLKMKEHVLYQQMKSSAVATNVQQVRHRRAQVNCVILQ